MTTLPRMLVLTDRAQTDGRSLEEVIGEVLKASVQDIRVAIVVREKDLPAEQRSVLVEALLPIVHSALGEVFIASGPSMNADGVHLSSGDPFPDGERPPIVGRSCHCLADVVAAQTQGCDYVSLSPIFNSASKPGYGPALGLDGLREVVDEVTVPVYALGGIDPSIVDACLRAGAFGVAVMGDIMRAGGRGLADACALEFTRALRKGVR